MDGCKMFKGLKWRGFVFEIGLDLRWWLFGSLIEEGVKVLSRGVDDEEIK